MTFARYCFLNLIHVNVPEIALILVNRAIDNCLLIKFLSLFAQIFKFSGECNYDVFFLVDNDQFLTFIVHVQCYL
jgi:hypothetical protein